MREVRIGWAGMSWRRCMSVCALAPDRGGTELLAVVVAVVAVVDAADGAGFGVVVVAVDVDGGCGWESPGVGAAFHIAYKRKKKQGKIMGRREKAGKKKMMSVT